MKLITLKNILGLTLGLILSFNSQAQNDDPAVTINVTEDTRVRSTNATFQDGLGDRLTGLTRNDAYEFVGLMNFDLPGKLVGTIDSVHIAWSFRKSTDLSKVEFLEYSSDWEEEAVTFENAPLNDFDTLDVVGTFDQSGVSNNVLYSTDITDYFMSEMTDGTVSLAVRSDLIEGGKTEFDIWSKDNPGGNPIPQILIYGDVKLAKSVSVAADTRVRSTNVTFQDGLGDRLTGLTRNGAYEFVGLMNFDLPGKVVGTIDSVHIAWSFRKSTDLSMVEFLEYSSDWEEEAVTFENAPLNDFDTLDVVGTFDQSGVSNNVLYSTDITDYFMSEMTDGTVSLAVRSDLIEGGLTEFDIWSKDNPGGHPVPQILIFGDVAFAQSFAISQDAKVRTGNPGNEGANFGADRAVSGLSRNDIYEFAGMMNFDIIGNIEGKIDSVHLGFTLRKNTGNLIEFLEYPTDWNESTITYANAPNNGFDTLSVINTFDASGKTNNTVRYSVDITDYFMQNFEKGIVSIGARAELISGVTSEFDIWSKDNTDGYPAPEILIFGDVVIENSVPDSLKLSDLQVDGVSLEDFDPKKLNYNVIVPFAEAVPTVTATALATTSTVEVVDATSIQGDTTLVIVRDTNMDSIIYNVIWKEGDPDRNAKLAALFVDGDTIPFFNPVVVDYTVDLPYGTTTVPTITANPEFDQATVAVTPAATINDTTQIVVTAQDVTITQTYKVAFNVIEAKQDPTLAMIIVDSDTLADFSASKFSYTYEHDGLDVPTVVAVPSDSNATVSVTLPSELSISGITHAIIEVIAEDGETKKTYTVALSTSIIITNLDDAVAIAVFPNPFVEKLTIQSVDMIEEVNLLDLNGRVLMNKVSNGESSVVMDLSFLAKGQYLVQVLSQDGIKTIKVVK